MLLNDPLPHVLARQSLAAHFFTNNSLKPLHSLDFQNHKGILESVTSNPRKYGNEPFVAVLIHGGPGAAGEMKPVAVELSKYFGVLEPLQTAKTIEGQVQELKEITEQNASLPAILVGYSWGAWLSFIFAATYPLLVKKLFLVSSGPFEDEYTKGMMDTRLGRLNRQERQEAQKLLGQLSDGKSDVLERFGQLISEADSFRPVPEQDCDVEVRQDIYQDIWPQASELRKSGELFRFGERIRCPVVAIHGDYDPHPADGVKLPLQKTLKDFRFIPLKNCGHKPWVELEAKDRFYELLVREINGSV